ncbi:hypothetical protein NCU05713 [Neurospora crassa OR74A]|uniref:Uncharacterized protein n=1 Tax=Neurospora crassa (strain ATCC 24698 / 74-OR23-1A / CBS 708.71 / DSM 1257 / FGSC 987) TaxID=367110 RepID=Q7SB99_NEUCR|nr:hypothetical protein NCU05713 [Neurospora crassa OR74A]EAA33663.1 hypothetical protein NCU05713 [Neurospora crassa OR74A]|eukprot:XP_962899.1 hypothetical protein NCU05713 [Neurospora crassa OR74A]
MSARSLIPETKKQLMEKRKTDFLVHVEIIRYMLSSLQDYFGSKHWTPKLCLRWCRQHLKTLTEFNLLLCDGYRWHWRCLEVFVTSDLVSRILELEPSKIDTYDAASSFRLPSQEDEERPSRQFILQEFRNILAADDADGEGASTYPTSLIRTKTLAYYLSLSPGDPGYELGNAKSRLDLSYALTEALGLFYKTSMMPRPWTEDTIEFMVCKKYENGHESVSIVTRMPMISVPDATEDDISILTSLLKAQSLESPKVPDIPAPKFPEIKALGLSVTPWIPAFSNTSLENCSPYAKSWKDASTMRYLRGARA